MLNTFTLAAQREQELFIGMENAVEVSEESRAKVARMRSELGLDVGGGIDGTCSARSPILILTTPTV